MQGLAFGSSLTKQNLVDICNLKVLISLYNLWKYAHCSDLAILSAFVIFASCTLIQATTAITKYIWHSLSGTIRISLHGKACTEMCLTFHEVRQFPCCYQEERCVYWCYWEWSRSSIQNERTTVELDTSDVLGNVSECICCYVLVPSAKNISKNCLEESIWKEMELILSVMMYDVNSGLCVKGEFCVCSVRIRCILWIVKCRRLRYRGNMPVWCDKEHFTNFGKEEY
jgi:hypothetical protein